MRRAAILRIRLLIYPTNLRRDRRGVCSAGLLRSRLTSCVRARARARALRALRAIRARHSGLTRQMYLTIMVYKLACIVGIVGQVGIVALGSLVRLTRRGRPCGVRRPIKA